MEKLEGQLNNSEQLPENENKQELSPEKKLENFRGEIAAIKGEEMKKKEEWEARGRKGEAYNPHFDLIKPEFLSKPEMDIYEKFKGGLNDEQFIKLRTEALSRFSEEEKNNEDKYPEYDSANAFLMYLANKIYAQKDRKEAGDSEKNNGGFA